MRPTENGQLELGGQAAMVEGRAEAEANGGAAGAGGEALSFCDERLPGAALQALHMMQRSRRFCDVVLHVGGGAELHAHRAVLAAASPHLLELFSADEEVTAMRPQQAPAAQAAALRSYSLNGACDRAALEKLVDYAYTARLEVKGHQVASVYRAASLLRMDRCARECARHLLRHLTVDNCLQTRALPGLAHDRAFAEQIDAFIAREFDAVSKSKILLSLVCVRVEVLNQTRQEMSLVVGDSISRLALDWMKRQFADDDNLQLDKLTEKTHLLYLAMDNSLQDCTEMPTGDLSDTEIVQDYKKLSLKNHTNTKQNKRKTQLQPAKPRVLIYSRDIGPRTNQEKDDDWKLIAATKVGEHNFLALVVLNGYLATLSVQLRCSQPLSPSPVATPITSRPASEEKPDLYCVMPNMSSVKCAVGCANLNNSLLVCGGYDRAECLRIVEAYDPQHNCWASLPPMREPRGRFDIAVVRGKVYAVGGSNGSSELSTVEVFDPERQKWCSIDPLPLARCNTGVCDLDDKVYCIGGWNGQAGIKQCDVYDPDTNKWASIAQLLTGRYQAGVCAMDGKLFAAGGCDAWNCLNTVEVYDPKENKWEFAKNMITARRGCGLAYFKGKLYAVGGSDGSHSLSSTEIFDPKDQTWTPGPSMTTPRANVAVAVIGNRLYAVGGFSGKTFLNSIEYLDESTDEWTTFVPKISLSTEAERARLLEHSVAAFAESLNSHPLDMTESTPEVPCSVPS
ncbi:hypothetical protein R5R35_014736 [Gryllus longicercus]|uniref:BTB domain-containing protein n=1 Tax=Gryllus longicercus TaxID=2509291 RepID=A0AAN9VMZ7_9ORTH